MAEELNFFSQKRENDVPSIKVSAQVMKVPKVDLMITNIVITGPGDMDSREEVSASEDLVAEDCGQEADRAQQGGIIKSAL